MTNKLRVKRNLMLVTSMSLALLFSPLSAMANDVIETSAAQPAAAPAPGNQIIKGKVLDAIGDPVIGATIMVAGAKTTTGTVTDIDGNFQINVKPGTKLQISYVGYDPLTVSAKNGMSVTLKENSTMLQGVEVVAYGVQKKVTMTGAVSSVKSEDLLRTPVSNVNNVLAGQLSGVTTVQTSGEPGTNTTEIFVRGKATWQDATPLIQVDGVEREMYDIDPNEIESITVLKDASATAVFGVRGANGVVLITTKRGAEGKAKITGTTSWTLLTPTQMVETASSYDYAKFYNQMQANDGNAAMFSDAVIEKFRTNSDPVRFPSMNWSDYIMKTSTLQQQHNVNISGGTSTVKYFISAGYYSQGSLFREWDKSWDYGYEYQRFNYRANLDINATKTTKISVNIAGKVDDKDTPRTGQGASGMIKAIYYATPFCSPGFVDGKYVVNSNAATDNMSGDPNLTLPFIGSTPMTYYAYQPGGYHYSNNKISLDLALEQKLDFWKWSQGLSFKIKGAYNTSYALMTTTTASVATYYTQTLEDGSLRYRKTGDDVDPSYSTSQSGKARDWYAEASLNYHRIFAKKHTVSALLLYNQSKEYYPSTYSDIPRTYVGLVGRVTYDFDNRYVAEFNVGYNGSENFAPDKRFGTFPAGSVGWIISGEKFWKKLEKAVSFFKLRASWGLVGNDKIGGSRFMYLADPYNVNQASLLERAGYSTGTYGYNFGVENSRVFYGAVEAAKNNPDVGWEKAFKQDYGVDINFLNNRLKVNFDYFKEHRTDILVQNYSAPTITGMTLPYSNLGETKSWGYEVSIGWNDNIGKDFRYYAKLNLSYNQNEIINDYSAPVPNTYQETNGKRIGSRALYRFWKYYEGEKTQREYEETFGEPFPTQLVATSQLQPGDCVYIDLDHNGKIDSNDMSRENPNSYTNDPEYICGLNFGFTWKRLSFSTQFTGAWNVSRVISGSFRVPFCTAASGSTPDQGGLLTYHVENTWTPGVYESQDALYPRATIKNASQNYAESTLWEKDASYVRCKTISIGYDFINPAFRKIGMSKCELSISAYNLFTLTPYEWGDPEATASSSPSYPLQRTYTASLKIGF